MDTSDISNFVFASGSGNREDGVRRGGGAVSFD